MIFTIFFFVVFSELFIINPTRENKEIVLKIIKLMNESPEMFKKSDLEKAVNILSNNKFYEIKSEIPKGLNFFKKVSKGKLNVTMELDTKLSNKYSSNVDVENNLIVLTDKFNENRNIIFVELTHGGQSSLNLYQTLIKTMNPSLVLVEQEPYVEKSIKYDNFHDLNDFKQFIKDFSGSNLEIKNNQVFKNSVDALCEVESIILNSLTPSSMSCNKKKVVLFDVPYHNFFKSFLHFSRLDPNLNTQYKLNSIRDKLTCLNLFEINNWLNTQEILGCKKCASFFNKKEVNWYPLHLEFLVNKNKLPNSSYIRTYKINKIFKHISEEKENVLIFSSNSKQLCYDFLEFNDDKSLYNSQLEFDDNFDYKELNSDYDSEVLSLAFLLKENFNNFVKCYPIKSNTLDLNLLKIKMTRDFEHVYLHNNEMQILSKELQQLMQDEISTDQNSLNQINRKYFKTSKNFTNDSSTNKIKSCEPYNLIKSILDYKKIF